MKGLRATDPALWPGHEPAISIETAEDLVAVAQTDGIELHTWNARDAQRAWAGELAQDNERQGPARRGAVEAGA
jgi:DNA primase